MPAHSDGSPGEVIEPEPAPSEGSFDAQRYHDDFVEIGSALKARYGDREPTEAEIRLFFRDRLVASGMTMEEAETMLDS